MDFEKKNMPMDIKMMLFKRARNELSHEAEFCEFLPFPTPETLPLKIFSVFCIHYSLHSEIACIKNFGHYTYFPPL